MEWHASNERWELRCELCTHLYVPSPDQVAIAKGLWERVKERPEDDSVRLKVANEFVIVWGLCC